MNDYVIIGGGIIPAEDKNILRQLGVSRIYTPKGFQLNSFIGDIVDLADQPALPSSANPI